MMFSNRLILRPPKLSDLNNFHRCFADKEDVKYYLNGFSSSVEESEKKLLALLNHFEKHHYGDYVVIDQTTNEFVGLCGFDVEMNPGKIDLGYVFLRSYWGKGFATEAALRVISHGFLDLNFNEIHAYVHAENKASIRVLTKCMMTFDAPTIIQGQPRLYYKLKKQTFLNGCLRNT